MNRYFLAVLITLLLLVGCVLLWHKPKTQFKVINRQAKPDTVYIQSKPTVKEKHTIITKYQPTKVTIYLKDTLYRDSIIHDTINTGTYIGDGKIRQNQLSPSGTLLISEYSIPESNTQITIDQKGFVEVKIDSAAIALKERKERRMRRLRVGAGIAIFIAGIIIGK